MQIMLSIFLPPNQPYQPYHPPPTLTTIPYLSISHTFPPTLTYNVSVILYPLYFLFIYSLFIFNYACLAVSQAISMVLLPSYICLLPSVISLSFLIL